MAAVDEHGSSPLHAAAAEGHAAVAAELLRCRDVDVDAVDEIGSTPLHWAVCNGHVEVAEVGQIMDFRWGLRVRKARGRKVRCFGRSGPRERGATLAVSEVLTSVANFDWLHLCVSG